MGLSIHINATASATLGISEVETIVRRWRAIACKFADEGLLTSVSDLSNKPDSLRFFSLHYMSALRPDFSGMIRSVSMPPIEGWMFRANAGEGCETLELGLCRYLKPMNPPDSGDGSGGERVPSDVGEEWDFQTSCKTQYASVQGWEHFRRCHIAIIELAAAAESLGVTVRIDDEGGWWPKRDVNALKQALVNYNRFIAGFAGALKDSLDEDAPDGGSGTGKRIPLQAAIFEHPDFERLEAEGRADGEDAKIREVIRKIKSDLKL